MKWLQKHSNLITEIISMLFILLFAYTATNKLLNINIFHMRLGSFPFISSYAFWIAWGVPILEVTIVVLFFFQKYLLTALYMSFTLMSIFTAYIILVLGFTNSIPCSCGGVISALGWKDHIIFNSAFIVMALIGILLLRTNKEL
ncbi:MauE/DoxX family redox-associated membrane protein [Confluentibacter sediminis]|uniref:MauE/DoxX family redox-associated membrane protein n=1 Tax=Confluentibacter sediminis TaxID=2219045 RepID=UPI001F21F552|nr:MauE/DoxX family redox-associated membrane protein [Confluentibacter sediminis]